MSDHFDKTDVVVIVSSIVLATFLAAWGGWAVLHSNLYLGKDLMIGHRI
jgi:hypothetical protein